MSKRCVLSLSLRPEQNERVGRLAGQLLVGPLAERPYAQPGLAAALDPLAGRIDEDSMRRMNHAVDGEHRAPADVARVIQGLAAGIGFLGGGAILKLTQEREITGLTTAAGIWLTAAIGVAVALVGSYLALNVVVVAVGLWHVMTEGHVVTDWSAALTAVTLLVVVYRTYALPQPATGVFKDRQGVIDVLRLIVPIVVLVILMDRALGFYISGALYLGFFARAIGKYRWHWVALSTVAIPVALFLIFEQGFRVPLPKSLFYPNIPV